jgi:hypothetical protein
VSGLQVSNAFTKLRELNVMFGPEESSTERIETFPGSYNFDETIEIFQRLTKLVVRGLADDSLLSAIGTSCYHLKYLDISGTDASVDGIKLLFYKSPKAEKTFLSICSTAGPLRLPKYLLQPLTKSYG